MTCDGCSGPIRRGDYRYTVVYDRGGPFPRKYMDWVFCSGRCLTFGPQEEEE